MTQRRHIVVDPQDLADMASLDGTEGCPAPLLGRCLLGCYYHFRPSKRPVVNEIDPTLFVEPVWTGTHPTDVQSDDEVVIDTLVESRPLRLMSTVFSSTLAPSNSQERAVRLDDINWFSKNKSGQDVQKTERQIYEHSVQTNSENSFQRTAKPDILEARDKNEAETARKTQDLSVHRYE